MTSIEKSTKVLGSGLVLLGCFILYSALPQSMDVNEAINFRAVSTAEASNDDTIRRSFIVSEGGSLELSTDRGSITVSSGPVEEMRIEVRRIASSSDVAQSFNVDFSQNGSDIRVKGETDSARSWLGRERAPEVEFHVEVPTEYNLKVDTKGGSINVGDQVGSVNVQTAGGGLTLGEISGSVHGQTSGGSIHLAAIDGDARLQTAGGSIKVDTITGDADVRTAGGSITLGEVRGTINARTSGGSITAGRIHELRGDSALETAGGGLTVNLDPSAQFQLDAETNVGRISTNLDLPIEESWTSSKMVGSVGDGGPMLRLRTAAGSISIERG